MQIQSKDSSAEPAGALSDRVLRDSLNFSLVLGGPMFQLLCRAHMSGVALELVNRRILIAIVLVWFPLLVLSAIEGRAFGSDGIAFLLDAETQARFLLSMPLLIVAELIVHERLRLVAKQFLDQDLFPPKALHSFDNVILSALRLRNSKIVELILIFSVYSVGTFVWRHYVTFDATAWYATHDEEYSRFSLAGVWYIYVSLPIYQFLLLRWYFRIFIWARFLWNISRLPLNLLAAHADRAGGLGFLSATVYAFVPLLVAHAVLLGGMIANRIFYVHASLLDFLVEIAVLFVFLACITLGPLLVFTPKLIQTKRTAIREYSVLVQRYVHRFEEKWLRGGANSSEQLLGNADIQSLADIGNSFQVIGGMRATPLTRLAFISVAVATLVPLLPLVLTLIPLNELMKRVVMMLF